MSVTLILWLLLVVATVPACVRMFYPPLPAAEAVSGAGAVVVLAGGSVRRAGHWTPTDASLRRLALGMAVARTEGLPLLLSGGDGDRRPETPTEAALMSELVPDDLGEVWLEQRSHNTYTNARYSADLLRERGIDTVILVTDREHMTRAQMCFHWHDIKVIMRPLDRLPRDGAWVPSTAALALLPAIWYEWVALAWYQLKNHDADLPAEGD